VRIPRLLAASAATALAVSLAACGAAQSSAGDPAESPAATDPTAADRAAFPVTVENCGRELTFEAPPERVVTLWQPSNELLLALGVQDRIVAMAGNYAPLPDDLAGAAEGIPRIGESTSWPSREVVLSQEPDLVVSELLEGFAFDPARGSATAEEIEATGAQVYATSACDFAEASSKTLDTVIVDLENLGAVFGVPDRAAELADRLERQRADVGAAVADRPTVRTAFYNGGEGPLNVLAGGVWGDAITTAGGENVFPADAFQVSAEEFAASDAEVVLVGTYPGQDFAALRDYLVRTFPELPAVRDDRIVEVPTIETEASVRVMDGLVRIAAALHPDAPVPQPSSEPSAAR
jgi:iron complex transport system substrate-binding protein